MAGSAKTGAFQLPSGIHVCGIHALLLLCGLEQARRRHQHGPCTGDQCHHRAPAKGIQLPFHAVLRQTVHLAPGKQGFSPASNAQAQLGQQSGQLYAIGVRKS